MTPAEIILRKNLVSHAGLSSAEWESFSAAIKDRAFFSSRVESARFLETARARIAEMLDNARNANGVITSRAQVVSDIMRAARESGIATGEDGMADPGSYARARVIVDTNAGLAAGYAHAEAMGTLGARLAFPAQELVRVEERNVPRNWQQRWRAAGGRISDGGRMVALKEDPIWVAISRFGLPYPPFDYNSGMGVDDISFDEAVELGVIKEDYRPPEKSPLDSFNEGLEAELEMPKDSPEWMKLKDTFGDQIRNEGGKVMWRSELVREVFDKSYGERGRLLKLGAATDAAMAKLPPGFEDFLKGTEGERMGLTLTKELITHVKDHEHYREDPRKTNMPLLPHDLDMIPEIWRNPNRILSGHNNSLVFEIDLADGGTLVLPLLKRGNSLITGTLYKRKKSHGT